MIYRRLRVVEDEEYGNLGLKFVKQHRMCTGRFTIGDGYTLAHDVLEHQQGTAKIGSIGDEMVALGGVCYTRAQWGEMRRDGVGSAHTPVVALSHDITQMAGLYFDQNIPFRQRLVLSRCDDPTGMVDDVIECARENWRKNTELDEPVSAEARDTYLEACRMYMQHGAKLAHRRYGSGLLASNMFWAMEEATRATLTHLEYEGQEFTLCYDFSGTVTINEVTGWDE